MFGFVTNPVDKNVGSDSNFVEGAGSPLTPSQEVKLS